MAEDDVGNQEEEEEEENSAHGHAELIAGLEKGDLKPNFYEGGFKTWECALDLADVMLDYPLRGNEDNQDTLGGDEDGAEEEEEQEEEDGGDVHVIELGCGTAVPSLMVFAQLVSSSSSSLSSRAQGQSPRRYRFTLSDYNSTVLRMVTLSNFLLTWWINSPLSRGGQVTTTTEDTETGMKEESIIQEEEEGELDIDATLLDSFKRDLARHGIELGFISGGWSTEFVQLALGSTNGTQPEIADFGMTFILASETIYSPSSLEVFSKTLLDLLRRSAGPVTIDQGQDLERKKSVALIAAKKVYFGVGGGIDEFLQVLHHCNQDQESIEVQERREITSGGVKRVVLEIGIDKH